MITEAKIILPRHCTTSSLEDDLLSEFGGYTRSKAEGAWFDAEIVENVVEKVYVYTVAAKWTKREKRALRDMAIDMRYINKEKSIYLSFNGVVEFIEEENV